MSKRSAEIQITKEQMQNGSYNFSAGGGGGPDDSMDPSKAAAPDVMSGRKIAPLKRRAGAGRGAGARSTGGGASLPNVFAGAVGQGFSFGNGAAASPSPAPTFGGGFGGAPAPAPSTSFGNGTSSGFSFGQEQPKPFASLAPAAPAAPSAPTNGTSGGLFGGGSFGASSAAPATNGMFGNANGTTNPTTASSTPSFGGFGATANNDKPASSIGFTFGGANSSAAPAAPASNFFGNTTGATPSFTFGGAPAAKEAPKPASTGFVFNQPAAASTEPAAPKTTTPSFNFNNSSFGGAPTNSNPFGGAAPTTSTSFGAAPTTSTSFGAAPTTSTSFGSAATETKPSGFVFGAKAPEPSSTSLFGKPPAAAPAQATGGFTFQQPVKETPAANTSLFQNNKPAEPSKPRFGYVGNDDTKPMLSAKDEAVKPTPLFGFVDNVAKKDEPPKIMFGAPATEKKEAPMFGSAPPATEKKEEPKSFFGAAAPAPATGGFTFKPAEKPGMFGSKPADAPASSFGAFGSKPADAPAPSFGAFGSKPADALAPSFGAFGATTKPASPPSTVLVPAAPSVFSVPAASSSNALSTARMRSPPLPAESQKWSANQLTDYYNMFALRSLNHFFKEELSKQEIFADLTPLCDAYTAEVKNIKELISTNQRYKFSESPLGNGVPGKRACEDNDAGGGKRRALGEEPKVTFAPSKSTTSQTLSSVLGGGSANEPSKSTEKVSPASIFDSHSSAPATSAWVNPFKKADTSNLPDDPEPDYGDAEEEPKRTGGLFDRASPTKQDNPFNPSTNLFSPAGDNTWSPEKGVKFFAPAPSGGLFGNSNGISNKGGLFGGTNGTSSSSGFSFGAKPVSTTPVTSASASESETGGAADDGEPSDAHPTKSEKDLSLQGPGEEDEDPVFQLPRAIIYDLNSNPIKTVGAGALRVLKNRATGKSRILVRSDLGKVFLNVALKKDIKYQLHLGKCLRVPEFRENGSIQLFGAKVKAEDLQKLLQTVEEVKA